MKRYFSWLPCKVTRHLFQDIPLLLRSLELRSQPKDLHPGIQQILRLVPAGIRFYGANPFMQAVLRHALALRNVGDGIAPLGDLADSFFFKTQR